MSYKTRYIKMRKQTPKQKIRQKLLSILKNEIRQDAWDNGEYCCQGCGLGGVPLDCSHILSVAQRKDLELDRDNINLFCRDCHNKWESGEEEKQMELLTYKKDIEYCEANRKIYNPPFDSKANEMVNSLNRKMNKFFNK